MAWLSRTALVVALWMASLRLLATLSCTSATLRLCLARLADPFCLRESRLCSRASFLSALARPLGLATLAPSERTIRSWMPTSIPMTLTGPCGVCGAGTSVQHTAT